MYRNYHLRILLAWLLAPLAALFQWLFWEQFHPFSFFLFYPAVFLAPWIGGVAGGIGATLLGAFLGFLFLEPAFTFSIAKPSGYFSIGLFLLMGIAFTLLHRRLVRNQAQLQALIANSDGLIWSVDRKYRLLVANPSFQAYARNVTGTALKPGDSVLHESFKPAINDFWRQLYSRALAGEHINMEMPSQWSHEGVFLECKLRPIRGMDGSITGAVAQVRDISKLKEQQLELERARVLADKANQAKSQFLTHMSHEIRNPLNAILGLSQILEREEMPEEPRELVQRIRSAGRGMLIILNDILDLAKIEAGRLRLDSRTFSLNQLLEQQQSLQGSIARERGLTFEISVAAGTPDSLIGDPLRLDQVLYNLIGNAIKFTHKGGVHLAVRRIKDDDAAVRLRFEVIDTGGGISPEVQASLFAPFIQAEGQQNQSSGGTGLGLAISKGLVENMGGRIGLVSEPGSGSTFWFELPFGTAAAFPEAPEESPADAGSGRRLEGMRVLIVDDSELNRYLVKFVLEKEGAITAEAGDGEQALEQLRQDSPRFDMVLMDVQMPVMDGLTATRAIRREPALASLTVIALSAGVLPEERENAMTAGIDGFINKPLVLEDLVAVLQRHQAAGRRTPA